MDTVPCVAPLDLHPSISAYCSAGAQELQLSDARGVLAGATVHVFALFEVPMTISRGVGSLRVQEAPAGNGTADAGAALLHSVPSALY